MDDLSKVEYNHSMAKVRVDVLLVERGLAESRSQAQRLVMAGQVRADGQVVSKPSVTVSPNVKLSVDQGPAYVSRGGEKLAGALEAFDIQVTGKVCADVGASTGGFSDCLLQHGAEKVYAIDVGKGILHWGLRRDKRVVVMEGTNARYLEELPEPVALISIDVSFISIKILLPVVSKWFDKDGGEVAALIKPQFEAGRKESSRGKGVIRNTEVHRRVLVDVLSSADEQGFGVEGLVRSPLVGPKGNVEFLAHLKYPGKTKGEISALVQRVIG
jgi:23S rRNA (cytidine1920-2'-O)/16S rRNA (cytidine1409-2'-O)-methyltransferase